MRFADEKDDAEDSEDSAEYFDNDEDEEEEEEYEDEEENSEEEEIKEGVVIVKQPKKEDAMRELEKAQRYKPAEGVKFVRYDKYGVPIEPDAQTGFDYQKHIANDDLAPGEGMYIEAPPEMVA